MDETHFLKFLPDEVKEKLEELINNDLQFVEIPKVILCSSCGSIPIFHYIYPCLHPYCRDCFKNVFQKWKKKCKVCKGELGTRILQRTSIEHEIYMLKAICPNQCYGCKDVIELNRLLGHIEVCQFTEKNQQSQVQSTKNEVEINQRSNEETRDLENLKIKISKMEKKMDDFTKLEKLLLENQKRWEEDIKQMSSENKDLFDEYKKLQDDNSATNKKLKAIHDKVNLLGIKSQQQYSNIDIDVPSLIFSTATTTTKVQTDCESNAVAEAITRTNFLPQAMTPEAIEKRFRKLENMISDISLSQMAIRNNMEQYIRVIVAAQLIPEDEPVIRETIFKKIKEDSFVNTESDLGKMIINDIDEFKIETRLIKKIVLDNNTNLNTVLKENSSLRNESQKLKLYLQKIVEENLSISDDYFDAVNYYKLVLKKNDKLTKLSSESSQDLLDEIKFLQKTISELKERVKHQSEDNAKFDKMAEQISKLENTLREMQESKSKDKTNFVNLLKEEPLKVSRNPWNNLNLNEQDEINIKIEEIKGLKNGSILWQIENYRKKETEESTLLSEPFYTSGNGFKMRVKMWFTSTCISMSIEQLPRKFDSFLPFFIHFRATLSILDQSEKSEKRDRVIVYEPSFGKDAKDDLKNIYFDWSILRETEDKNIYLKNDKIFIKGEIEPLSCLFPNYFSNDGILVWNINYYERTKQESIKKINEYFYSEYFHSSKSGFRMKARLGFSNTKICFYLLFLVGEFDSKLPSYFNHKCTISLVNQESSSSSQDLLVGSQTLNASHIGAEQVRERMSSDFCAKIVISQAEVEKKPFQLNDKVIVKFVIEAI